MNCKKGEYLGNCPLCGREMTCGKSVSEHHVVPKSMGGNEKVFMHHICHNKVHTLFTERELAQTYNNFDALKSHPELEKFIKWVRKQPPDYVDKNRTSARLKQKRLFAKQKKRL
jgi:5-methylcytosine-specific restriction endonuclease McrA